MHGSIKLKLAAGIIAMAFIPVLIANTVLYYHAKINFKKFGTNILVFQDRFLMDLKTDAFWITIVTLTASIIAALFLVRIFTKPIGELIGTAS